MADSTRLAQDDSDRRSAIQSLATQPDQTMYSTPTRPSTTSPSASGPSATSGAIRSAIRCARRSRRTKSFDKLGELGAYGVNLHDNDLVPRDATTGRARQDRPRVQGRRSQDSGMSVPMATTNLFGDPVFRDGAFTSNDARVRAYALQKTMRSMDLGVELGAETYVFWGGREGTETNAGEGRAGSDEVVPRRAQLPLRVLDLAGLQAQVRARAQAERAARRHLPADDRPRAGVHLHARPPGDGRPQSGSRARHDRRARFLARRGAGDRSGQALSHRSQRSEAGPLRSGPSLRQRGRRRARSSS